MERYTDEDALRAATLAAMQIEWRTATGADWTDRERANFIDVEVPAHERRALEVTAQLHAALVAVAQFSQDYQRVPGTEAVVATDGTELPPTETFETRRLLHFVERVLPDLDGRVRDVDGKIVAVSRGLQTDVKRRTPIPALERREVSWLAKIRGRVVALLGDTRTSEWSCLPDFRRRLPGWQWSTEKGLAAQRGWTLPELHARLDAGEVEKHEDGSVRLTGPVNDAIEKLIQRGEIERDRRGRLRRQSGYWANLGFRVRPTPRQMACASLLLEKWPKITTERLAKGLTVEAVVAEEQTAIKRIGDARTDPDKLPFGEKACARQQELDAKLAQLRESSDFLGADRFWRTEYAAFHNAASTEDQLCEECGALFEIGATRPTWRMGSRLPVYCSDACRSKVANRGRPQRDRRSLIAKEERARRENTQAWQRHAEGCARCKSGEPCGAAARYEAFARGMARTAASADAMAPGRTVSLRADERALEDEQQ